MLDCRRGRVSEDAVYRVELTMNQANITTADRSVVTYALEKAEATDQPAVAIEFPSGEIVTGKTSALLGASSAAILNALKKLAGIDENIDLISPEVIEPIQILKVNHFGNQNPRLHTDETLLALSICAKDGGYAQLALEHLHELRGAEAHSSVILAPIDVSIFKKLGVNITCEAVYQPKKYKG